MSCKWILSFVALLPLAPVQAQQFEDLDTLDRRVVDALGDQKAKPIDRRLKLARCPEPVALDVSTPASVALRCNSIGWRIRVPTEQGGGPVNVGEILVRRGEVVEIRIKGQDFEIGTTGLANQNGYRGERIIVKTSTGGAGIAATVVEQGVVHITD